MAAKKARRKTGRRSALPLIAGLAGAVGVALVVLQLLPQPGAQVPPPREEPKTSSRSAAVPVQQRESPRSPVQPLKAADATVAGRPSASVSEGESPPEAPPAPRPSVAARDRDHLARVPRVAIVIDDCGYDDALAERFAQLDIPLTFAVIPRLAGSRDCAEIAFSRGHEVILHQPMQPDGYPATQPGEGALLVGMPRKQVTSTLTENLGSIPHVSGLNNHMGSAATSDASLMEDVMGGLVVLREQYPGLYFLDSKTSAHTVAYDTARRRGLPTAMRSVFLDHDESVASVMAQLQELFRTAEEQGEAIGIGHVKAKTLAALEATLARLEPDEFDFVFASELAR